MYSFFAIEMNCNGLLLCVVIVLKILNILVSKRYGRGECNMVCFASTKIEHAHDVNKMYCKNETAHHKYTYHGF